MNAILDRLKQETWPHHQRLEQRLDLLNPTFSRQDYLRLIQAFWGYYQPMESSLAGLAGLRDWLPDLDRRVKLPWLEKDLLALGMDGDALARLPLCQHLPPCTDAATALGCLYVMEGSTLGGQVISRHLKRSLALDADNGAAFFHGYGEATGAMWQAFRQQVNAVGTGEDRMVEAACTSFLSLERWLCPNPHIPGTPS